MMAIPTGNAPLPPSERVLSIDVLRGFALLGILIINIQGFSMIEAAFFNPTTFGDLTGINRWVWILSHVFAEQKFLTIFSILFGAGILLITDRAQSRGQSPAGLHYRRMLWLIVIGMMHAYLLWYGDILVAYGLCALLVYLFRKLPPQRLLIIGLLTISLASFLSLLSGWSLPFWSPEAGQGLIPSWNPGAEIISEELAHLRGGWLEQMAKRVPTTLWLQTVVFFYLFLWKAGGLMLVGMALFKWGVLTAKLSTRLYLSLMVIGFGIGFPVVIFGVIRNFAAGWTLDYSMFWGSQFNYWGSLLIALGYINAIMLISKSMLMQRLVRPLAAVGRMAFTNYILQTVISTTIFYGHGFGLFGQVERKVQILIVFAIWAFQLIASPIWLRYFRFGPLEWLWRSLTYLRLQPILLLRD